MRFYILLVMLVFSCTGSAQNQAKAKDVEELIRQLELEKENLDKEIEKTDHLIKQHDELIKKTDDDISKIDKIIDSTYIPEPIPLLKAPTKPLTEEQKKLARRKFLDGEVSYWFNNILTEDLNHQVFVSYMIQIEGIEQPQIQNFTPTFKKMLWRNFCESQREDMLQVLTDSKMDVAKISKDQIYQAWDYALNRYIKKYNLKKGKGFNPGFSIYHYKDKERIN